ncbi:MAG: YbaB/EbfC family nucleoid-associated protein [Acidimicrobiales bacterium]
MTSAESSGDGAKPADSEAASPDDVIGADADLGGLDMSSLFAAATEMQQQMAEAQETAATTELEGVAGGGAVRIHLTGTGDFLAVHIDPSAVDPADVEMLQDLVLAALHDATLRVQEFQQTSMANPLSGLGDLLGGGLPELPGLPGMPGTSGTSGTSDAAGHTGAES